MLYENVFQKLECLVDAVLQGVVTRAFQRDSVKVFRLTGVEIQQFPFRNGCLEGTFESLCWSWNMLYLFIEIWVSKPQF